MCCCIYSYGIFTTGWYLTQTTGNQTIVIFDWTWFLDTCHCIVDRCLLNTLQIGSHICFDCIRNEVHCIHLSICSTCLQAVQEQHSTWVHALLSVWIHHGYLFMAQIHLGWVRRDNKIIVVCAMVVITYMSVLFCPPSHAWVITTLNLGLNMFRLQMISWQSLGHTPIRKQQLCLIFEHKLSWYVVVKYNAWLNLCLLTTQIYMGTSTYLCLLNWLSV